MKARIKKTGEIVNLASYATLTLDVCDSWGSPIEMKPEEIELIQDKTDDFDWQSYRNKTAKDILCAMLTDQRISVATPYKDLVKMSLECTNELIKQIKEKKEK